MRYTIIFFKLIFVAIFLSSMFSCQKQKDKDDTIKIPLSWKKGYGSFAPGISSINSYANNSEDNPLTKTFLQLTGKPKGWTDLKFGHIELNAHQSLFQNYVLGNIDKDQFLALGEEYGWKTDSLKLSKEPIKSRVGLVYGKDSDGKVKVVVDANNNLDLSDDKVITPYQGMLSDTSLLKNHSVTVSYQSYVSGKIINRKSQVTIMDFAEGLIVYNIAQYAVADFNGNKIAVIPYGFTNTSFNKAHAVVLDDSISGDDRQRYTLNEFININDDIYQYCGVNENEELILKKMELEKDAKIYSNQVGYHLLPFKYFDVTTKVPVDLNKLTGKYVFVDFWATWCVPCLKEMPHYKEIYDKVDRSKFEIVGIVGDSKYEVVLKTIKKHEMNWLTAHPEDSKKMTKDYNVESYPTSYLVNPEGKIIAEGLRGKGLDEKLKELNLIED